MGAGNQIWVLARVPSVLTAGLFSPNPAFIHSFIYFIFYCCLICHFHLSITGQLLGVPLPCSAQSLSVGPQAPHLLSHLHGLLGTRLFTTQSLLLLGFPARRRRGDPPSCVMGLSLCFFCSTTWGPVTHHAGQPVGAPRASVPWELGSL